MVHTSNLAVLLIFFLLFSFLVLAKCQVLNVWVDRSGDQVLQGAYFSRYPDAWMGNEMIEYRRQRNWPGMQKNKHIHRFGYSLRSRIREQTIMSESYLFLLQVQRYTCVTADPNFPFYCHRVLKCDVIILQTFPFEPLNLIMWYTPLL